MLIFRILVVPLEGVLRKNNLATFLSKKTNSKNNMNIKTTTEVQTSQKLFGNERIRMGCVSISFPSTRVNSAEENGLTNNIKFSIEFATKCLVADVRPASLRGRFAANLLPVTILKISSPNFRIVTGPNCVLQRVPLCKSAKFSEIFFQ